MDIEGLAPFGTLLFAAVVLDAVFGDPKYAFHPARLIGRTLTALEAILRRCGFNGYGGGVALMVLLSLTWVLLPSLFVSQLYAWRSAFGLAAHVLVVYTVLALRDLIDHVWAVEQAARVGDLAGARVAAGLLVGRDTAELDFAGCRRAAIESLAENFVDGFLSPVLCYVLVGLPGILLCKVVSTMDSMIGYKSPRYLRFGWCAARLDDGLNYVPARLAWFVLGLSALFHAGLSAGKGWRVGFQHHARIPGPNPGWSEATMAGILQRRLIGPIRKDGTLVTDVWIGHSEDPVGGKDGDVSQAIRLIVTAAALIVALATLI